MAMNEPGLMALPGMEGEAPPMEAPSYADTPPAEMEERSNEVVSSFLDTARDVLSREQKEVLVNVLEKAPVILDIVEQVFRAASDQGPIEGPGTETSDSVPANLSDGEFVFTAKAVKTIGVDKLRKMMEDAESKYDEMIGQQEQSAGQAPSEKEAFKRGGLAVSKKAKKEALQSLGQRRAREEMEKTRK